MTDETGKLTEVILPIEEYRELEEIPGMDLSEADRQSLKKAQDVQKHGNTETFRTLDD